MEHSGKIHPEFNDVPFNDVPCVRSDSGYIGHIGLYRAYIISRAVCGFFLVVFFSTVTIQYFSFVKDCDDS